MPHAALPPILARTGSIARTGRPTHCRRPETRLQGALGCPRCPPRQDGLGGCGTHLLVTPARQVVGYRQGHSGSNGSDYSLPPAPHRMTYRDIPPDERPVFLAGRGSRHRHGRLPYTGPRFFLPPNPSVQAENKAARRPGQAGQCEWRICVPESCHILQQRPYQLAHRPVVSLFCAFVKLVDAQLKRRFKVEHVARADQPIVDPPRYVQQGARLRTVSRSLSATWNNRRSGDARESDDVRHPLRRIAVTKGGEQVTSSRLHNVKR